MNNKISIISIILIAILGSCQNNVNSIAAKIDFGECGYYKSFLWSNTTIDTLKKTLEVQFNPTVRHHPDAYITLEVIIHDKKGNLSLNDFDLIIDNIKQPKNEIVLYAIDFGNKNEITIGIVFKTHAIDDTYKGFIRVSDYQDIDIVNNSSSLDTAPAIFKWEADFERKMNPLLKTILFIIISILILLFIWFVFLQRKLYPRFKGGQIIISVPDNEETRINLAGKIGCYIGKFKQPNRFFRIFCGNYANILPNEEWFLYIKPAKYSEHRDPHHKRNKLAKLIKHQNINTINKIYPEGIPIFGTDIFYHNNKYQIDTNIFMEYLYIRHEKITY
ncbi:MAG: hypothetical protein K8S18_06425 [Desulfobacula sp.]|nr:hypothetical protein [Desulfobacula sp.]